MSFLVTGKTYFSDAIICSLNTYEWHKSIPKPMLDTYCYIHATFTVEEDHNEDIDTLYPFRGMAPVKSGQEYIFHRSIY